MKLWLAKKVLGGITEKVMKAREIKRLRDYVEKDNELDLKVRELDNDNSIFYKQLEITNKKIDKYGKYIEELEKDMAIVKKDSHPPIFGKDDYKDIMKRLLKLEKRRK